MADIFNDDDEDKIFMFKKTYNASYVKNFSENKLRVLREDCNPILQKLIDNLSISNTYQYIEGPKWVKKFVLEDTDEDGDFYYRAICLFGEKHGNSTEHCKKSGFEDSIPFVEYLKRLSRETRSFVDVYIELPMFIKKPEGKEVEPSYYNIQGGVEKTSGYLSRIFDKLAEDSSISFDSALKQEISDEFKYESTSETINDVVNEFKECLQPSTRGAEKCQLLRMHNIDVRSFWVPYIDTDDLSYSFRLIYGIIGNNFSDIEKCIELFNRTGAHLLLYTLSRRFRAKELYDIFYSNTSIQKELERTDIQNYIETFIKSEIENLEDDFDFDDISMICRIINKRKDCITKNDLALLFGFCVQISALIVDTYCISRMFKKHDVKDNFQPRQSINMIVYAGQQHSERYGRFFTWLKNNQDDFKVKKTYEYVNDNDLSCVKMFD